ncbi:MAG: lipoyl(octanoyl) transferase LipB [Chloroflexi bacterium]|nr:lipoyl(octanoyl) transferase LipB [Chloroflexota bacterium]
MDPKGSAALTGYWLDLGLVPYAPAFQQQEQVLAARMGGSLPSTIILQENWPVFTIGRTGSRANILASAQELERLGIEVLEVNRGGDITYHGPGQLIASPLLYLGDINLNANQYLHRLEDVLIELLAGYGVQTGKKPDYPGVWLDERKIAAVGIAVRHGYTFHGFSLNVSLDLTPFGLINPCGVPQMPVTSLHEVLCRTVPMSEIKEGLRAILESTFGLSLRHVAWSELQHRGQPTL